MTNPIIAEINRLAPDLEINDDMRHAIDKNPDPKQTADRLKGRIEDWRNDFARDAEPSFDPSFIPYATILSEIDLSKNYASYGVGISTQMAQLGRRDNFALGRHVGFQEGDDPLRSIYRWVFGREIDDAGEGFWRKQLAKGVPPWMVIAYMLMSDELAETTDQTISVSWSDG